MIPYPHSPVITSMTWDPESREIVLPSDGDNWPATEDIHGDLYTAYGDGKGFSGTRQLSLGFARVTGWPHDRSLRGANVPSNIDATGGGRSGIKASGMLAIGDGLYCFVRNYAVNGDYRHSRLAHSADHGKTWQWADWHFTGTFGCPDFIQYGAGYDNGPANVYVVSQDNGDAYSWSPHIVLARVPVTQIMNRAAWEFFSGSSGIPAWSPDIFLRAPVFIDRNATQRVSMSFSAALGRYILVTPHMIGAAVHSASLGVFDAPDPWGPWTTAYYADRWSSGESYQQKFPVKYMSPDGKHMRCLFSGQKGVPYAFTLRSVALTLA